MDLLYNTTTTSATGGPGSHSDHPIEVTVGGHTLRASREMADRFVRYARLNAVSSGAPLTVLVHADGVELFHITPSTP